MFYSNRYTRYLKYILNMDDDSNFNIDDSVFEEPEIIDDIISQQTVTDSDRTLTALSQDFERTLTVSSQHTATALTPRLDAFGQFDSQPTATAPTPRLDAFGFDLLNDVHPYLDELGNVFEQDGILEQLEVVDDGQFQNIDVFNINEDNLPLALRRYDENSIEEYYLGLMNRLCTHCNAFYFYLERESSTNQYKKCCDGGRVRIAQLEPPPPPLNELYNRRHEYSQIFFNEIRALNSVFSFTSIGCNLDERYANATAGGYTFRIHGSVYHRIGSLLPADGQPARFAQIFFYNTAEQVSRRHQIFSHIPQQLLVILTQCFHENNHFVQQFQHIGPEVLQRNAINMRMVIQANLPNLDRSRFNLPLAEHEIAAIVPDDNPEGAERSIIVRGRNNEFQFINELNVALDPLSYILLYPRGELGWDPNMRLRNLSLNQNRVKRLTLLKYTRHRIHRRQFNFNIVTKAGKLFQQYLVDMYVRIEKTRLDYIRFHQNELRADLYQGLADAHRLNLEQNYGPLDANRVGRFYVLPSSFVGGPRYMTELYQDAMAIVRKYGKPDLFITITCNPNWREIQENLEEGETSWDRPELVNRVFNLKLDKLIELITESNIFGNVIAIIYTVEFQKRGLPHAHILLILDRNSKLNTPQDIDRCVSAELPNPNTNPVLFNLVSTLMIHRPCQNNADAVCKINNRCSKNFPKPYIENTVIDQGTYPKYKRSVNGPRIQINNQEIGNEYVVPHNKFLLKRLNCHINVEVCSSLQAVKYLYKYVYKGHDCATIQLSSNRFDEISNYVSARFISASEAAWRVFSFKLHLERPNIYRLPVHLENHQQVIFNVNQDIQRILDNNRQTKLTAWFISNSNDPQGRNLLYAEYPEFYVYDKSTKLWRRRDRFIRLGTIGRIYNVSPREGERFYLRLMLNHIRGATSFQALKTVSNVVYQTYQQAAAALGK